MENLVVYGFTKMKSVGGTVIQGAESPLSAARRCPLDTLTAGTEHGHHRVIARRHRGCVLGERLHAVWHGLVVLAHDALAVAGVHVRHLDTAGAVAASAVSTTHEHLTGLLGLEQALAG